MHTSVAVAVTLSAEALPVDGAGMAVSPTFNFVLCHEGMNKNGDFFLREELSTRYATSLNKKVDLQHSQAFVDIVGGIIAAEYREDENGGRIDCIGELFLGVAQHAALAYTLMKRGIVSQVSMECDYAEGECSICGKRVKAKSEYCVHLQKYKGGDYQGKPCYEILHGVTFTGVGILDRQGADGNARITQVASQAAQQTEGGSTTMADEKKELTAEERAALEAAEAGKKDGETPSDDAAKKGTPPGGGDAPGDGEKPVNKDEQIAMLQKENDDLKKQIADMQKELDAMKQEKQAAENKARASKLVRMKEAAGKTYKDAAERDADIERYASMSDEAFAAAEAAISDLPTTKVDGETPKAEADKSEKKDGDMQTDAAKRSATGDRPLDVNDTSLTLQDKLSQGMQQAWKDRQGG